ncbi:hypothetical protein CRG98_046547 [Punica granatum]|uniref:Uncharacterized protein n=1 Tax=Punica granatum TaxID=22663 RepID=A0A2I0HMW6_PUNGR|nr:hypothetical protein CRG98_046547 [Punica granatum]
MRVSLSVHLEAGINSLSSPISSPTYCSVELELFASFNGIDAVAGSCSGVSQPQNQCHRRSTRQSHLKFPLRHACFRLAVVRFPDCNPVSIEVSASK